MLKNNKGTTTKAGSGICPSYKPYSLNTIIAVFLLFLITLFFIVLVSKIDTKLIVDFYHYVFTFEGKDGISKITLNDYGSIILLIFILLDYIILSIVLLIIIIKDEQGIRFAKLNEMARIEEKFKNTNSSKELYKKYMDTLAEI